ncbi:MAG: EAL domain-containing protein [Nannocystaceae bacterium]|nr:EAL domain-containing protein [Nannocystaceae bacterium]
MAAPPTLAAYVGPTGPTWEAVRNALAPLSMVAGIDRIATAQAARDAVVQKRYGVVVTGLDNASSEGWAFLQQSHPGVAVLCVTPATDATALLAMRAHASKFGAMDVIPSSEFTSQVAELSLRHASRFVEASDRLAAVRARFELAVAGSRDGIWEWDLETGTAYFSARWMDVLGYRDDEISPSIEEWFNRVHPHDLARLRDDLQATREEPDRVHELEHRLLSKDGRYCWVLSRGAVFRDAGGRAIRMAGSMTDTSSMRERVAEIREASRYDAVTHLPRQDLFMEKLARSIELVTEREGYLFAVLLIEVDRFRAIAEGVGQQTADTLLAQLAQRLHGCVEEEDVVARFEGARFSILLSGLDNTADSTRVAERVHRVMERPFDAAGEPIYLTVDIGMTSSDRAYSSPEAAISDASAAAARVSTNARPRRRPQMFATHMRIEAVEVLRLETALRQAIESKQFMLHYQPIVSLTDLRLLGFEALIRWHHPSRGLVSPVEFIPVAEKTGMIVEIGRWVFREAAQQLARWNKQFPDRDIGVNVNISGKQIGDPQLLPDLLEAAKSNNLTPQGLRVELTETELMENASEVQELLVGLRQHGINVYLDDFGTGYSSLSYLDRFPVDGLKIDRSFVMVLDGTPDSATMVNTIIGLAGNLALSVVAEGIENQAQLDQLRSLGCVAGQGFLLSRPVDVARATEIVARGTLAP